MLKKTDNSLELLLDLDKQIMVIDTTEEGEYWVKFVINQVPASQDKPHGIDYPLTLHGPDNKRLIGFDNAHSISTKGRKPSTKDHQHKLDTVKPYVYKDAATLLEDFWQAVDDFLKKKGQKQ
jgi:hypothetical protein